MRVGPAVVAASLLLGSPVAAGELPGAAACERADRSEAAWQGCVEAMLGPCEAHRATEGDGAWAGCLSERAAAWEEALATRSAALRALGHEAGNPAALAAFLAERTETCRAPERVAALVAAHGHAAADGAVLRCELVNSLHRAVLLDRLAREAMAARP